MIRFMTEKRRRLIIVGIVILFTLAGIYLRADWRVKNELWTDETFQIKPMKGSLYETIIHSQINFQFPGDYVLVYPFYQWFGPNKWGLAIPHIIVTILGFYLLYLLCSKYFKTLGGYIVTFAVFAYNYNLIDHAFEIRPYSVLVTLSLAVFLVIQHIFVKERPSFAGRIFVSIFIFLTLLFHVFGLYLLFFSYIFHLLFSRKQAKAATMVLKHLKYYSPAVILALPLLYLYFAGSISANPVDTFAFIGKGIIPVAKGVFGNLTGSKVFYPLLAGIFINFFLPHKERFKQMMFFVIMIIIPIGILFLVCFNSDYWFIQRLFIWAIPLFAFFLGWCWDSIVVYLSFKLKGYNVRNLRNS